MTIFSINVSQISVITARYILPLMYIGGCNDNMSAWCLCQVLLSVRVIQNYINLQLQIMLS